MLPSERARFIIALDDYGLRETAGPILRLAREGKADRVAVLVRYVSPEAAQALLAAGVAIDLHLDLIRLLGRGETIEGGVVGRTWNFLSRILSGAVSAPRAEAEWRSQIEAFRSLFGRLPDGLNSHEHVHFYPPLTKALLGLAKEYGIGYVRFARRGIIGSGAPIGIILSFLRRRSEAAFRASGLASAEYLVSLDWLPRLSIAGLSEKVPGTIELVAHPERPAEYAALEEAFAIRIAEA